MHTEAHMYLNMYMHMHTTYYIYIKEEKEPFFKKTFNIFLKRQLLERTLLMDKCKIHFRQMQCMEQRPGRGMADVSSGGRWPCLSTGLVRGRTGRQSEQALEI